MRCRPGMGIHFKARDGRQTSRMPAAFRQRYISRDDPGARGQYFCKGRRRICPFLSHQRETRRSGLIPGAIKKAAAYPAVLCCPERPLSFRIFRSVQRPRPRYQPPRSNSIEDYEGAGFSVKGLEYALRVGLAHSAIVRIVDREHTDWITTKDPFAPLW